MSERPQMMFAFPRPGPALKAVLITLTVTGLLGAAVVLWVPGGEKAFLALVCATDPVLHGQIWRLVTSGFLMTPGGPGSLGHLFGTLIGLYFLSPDLERRWGSARFVRFLVVSVVVGNVLVIVLDKVAHASADIFHPREMFGAGAAITATAIAWSRENAERRLLFPPVKGKQLFWLIIGLCVLTVILKDTLSEGAAAPFGGIIVGLLLGGSPSAVRSLYLQTKLALLQKQSGAGRTPSARILPRRGRGGSPLRVVQGGLEEDLSKRQPPKDKRYLN